jgi:hypothetical protein
MDIKPPGMLRDHLDVDNNFVKGGDLLGSVVKKRRKKMRKHKHRKLLAKTRHQRRKGK